MPAAAQEAPRPGALSTRVTPRPASAARQAMPRPITPAPMTTTSLVPAPAALALMGWSSLRRHYPEQVPTVGGLQPPSQPVGTGLSHPFRVRFAAIRPLARGGAVAPRSA